MKKKRQPKHCKVCGKIVERGMGLYFKGILVHKKDCQPMAKTFWWKYGEK